MKKMRKCVSLLLALTIIFGLFSILPLKAGAAGAVSYIYRYWDDGKVISETETCTQYTNLADRSSNILDSGCYVVTEDLTITDRLYTRGSVDLILCDGVKLQCKKGIEIGYRLWIYGQSEDSGILECHPFQIEEGPDKDSALIEVKGQLRVFGGHVIAEPQARIDLKGAVIGGGNGYSSDEIFIYGGTVEATAHYEAAAIGGGKGGGAGDIRIYGGTVTAECSSAAAIGNGVGGSSAGNINIYGGTVTAKSHNFSAGIGGSDGTDGPEINISGGTVNAYNLHTSSFHGGAGIGSGRKANRTKPINITGGAVFAYGTAGAGIGAGSEASASGVNIMGGVIAASASLGGAGIGGGYKGDAADVKISGAIVNASSCSYSSATEYQTAMIHWAKSIDTKPAFYKKYEQLLVNAFSQFVVLFTNALVMSVSDDQSGCGIGGGYKGSYSSITISGEADVTAESEKYAPGIGAGKNAGSCGTITIENAKVKATGGSDAAGIGTGDEPSCSPTIHINNSTVRADGGAYGAGIGGGDAGNGGSITIDSSNVRAYGGKDAAGIGGGEGGSGDTIKIYDSDVYAEGSCNGSGIGNGEDGYSCSVEVNGASTVEAWGGNDGGMAFCWADNGLFYSQKVYLSLTKLLKLQAGKNSGNCSSYYGYSRLKAAWSNRYAKLLPCDHPSSEMRWHNDMGHAPYCTFCGTKTNGSPERHQWSNGVCTVCGCTAVMKTVKLIEQDSSGEVVTEVEVPTGALYYLPECKNAPEGKGFVFWDYQGQGMSPDTYVDVQTNMTIRAVYSDEVDTYYVDETGKARSVTALRLPEVISISLSDGWYVVEHDILVETTMHLCGNVNLILCDGATMSFDFRYDSDQSIHAWGENDTLKVYGQRQQTGTLDFGTERENHLSGFEQYGGIVKAQELPLGAQCVLGGGKFQADWIDSDGFTFSGGNAQIGNVFTLDKKVNVSWKSLNDSLQIGDIYDYPELMIDSEKQIKDESGNVYSGKLGTEQFRALTGQKLTPYVNHSYSEPEWIWSDEYTNATAVFRCTDAGCSEEQRVDAEVTCVDKDNIRTSTAVCNFYGQSYTTTHQTKLLWDVKTGSFTHGAVEADSIKVKPGDLVQLIVTPEAGYSLCAISVTPDEAGKDVNLREDYTFVMPACDVTVSASFAINKYTVTWKNGDTVLETDENVAYGATPQYNGETPTKAATAEHNYIFVGWSPAISEVTGDVTYTAQFENAAQIVIIDSEHGTVTADKNTACEGMTVTLTVTPDDKYKLGSITVKDENNQAVTVTDNSFVMPGANVTVSATFVLKTVNISVNGIGINANNCSDILGDGTVSYDFDTNTLILTNANIEVKNGNGIRYNEHSDQPFNIILVGDNRIADDNDDGSDICYGIVMYAAAPSFKISGNGTLDIEMSSESPRIGIQARKTLQVERARVSVNVSGSENATAVDLVYSDSVLKLIYEARVELNAGGYALQSNRNVKNLDVGEDCFFEAISATQAFHSNIHLGDYHPEVIVNTEPRSDGADYWDNSTVLTDYKYINMRGEDAPYWVKIVKPQHGTVTSDLNRPFAFLSEYIRLTAIPDPGYELESITVSNDDGVLFTGKQQPFIFVMPSGDVTVSAAFKRVDNGVNLILGGDITSNYYIDYTKYKGAATVTYTYNAVNEKEQNVPVTETIDLSDIPAGLLEGKRIKLTVSQASAQIAETTHIEILNAKGEVMEALDYSTKSYCDSIIAMSDETLAAYAGNAEEAARLKTLAHSLIAYAEAAQAVFAGYETTKVTCESDAIKAQIAAATATPGYIVNNAGQVKFSSVSFACTKDARLRLFLNTQSATSIPAAPETDHGTAALKYTMKDGAKQYFVEVSGIDAVDFDKKITVTYGGSEITLSVLDFCALALKNGNTAMQTLAKTLIVYNTNAKAYFG